MSNRNQPSEHKTHKPPRKYRTRKDPFEGLFTEYVVPLLKQNPEIQPITLLDALDKIAPGKVDHSNLRTLQRRVKRWRAQYGPDQEVIFRQLHAPGEMGVSI